MTRPNGRANGLRVARILCWVGVVYFGLFAFLGLAMAGGAAIGRGIAPGAGMYGLGLFLVSALITWRFLRGVRALDRRITESERPGGA